MSVLRSVVKWFDAKKGYGFIVHPKGGNDIFVHYSQIHSEDDFKTLQTGEVVEFELHDGPKGPHAKEVENIDTEATSASQSEEDEAREAAPPSSNGAPTQDRSVPQKGPSLSSTSISASSDNPTATPESVDVAPSEMPEPNAPHA